MDKIVNFPGNSKNTQRAQEIEAYGGLDQKQLEERLNSFVTEIETKLTNYDREKAVRFVAVSMLSDVQEMIDGGLNKDAVASVNRVKFLLTMDMREK